ncbi:GATA zinc finger [Colletotrichum costaricense]|uniref:GATA zinc finger n=1 Tax=Colletotrichum costaricense TaxID=1209916 RepID=A0AAI9YMY3_9PEZI|nr:GATA zinc finger [Colletotrichum costaricense]KAK1516947.1 GATA zinc finger [Colletotrichum costaricense]
MVSVKPDAQLNHKRPKLGLQMSAEAEGEAAANAFASDAAPDDADAHSPLPPISFDQIKATEMIQRGLVDGTCSKGGCECGDCSRETTSSNSRILAAQSLSEVIASNLDDLALLSYRSTTDADRQQSVSPRATRKRRSSTVAAFDRTSKVRRVMDDSLCCHSCQATSTPQWRDGPDGRWTLCNVCGLLYAHNSRKNASIARPQTQETMERHI